MVTVDKAGVGLGLFFLPFLPAGAPVVPNTCVRMHVHAHVCVRAYVCVRACVHVCVFVAVCVCLRAHMCACISVCVCVCAHTCVCARVCVCACVHTCVPLQAWRSTPDTQGLLLGAPHADLPARPGPVFGKQWKSPNEAQRAPPLAPPSPSGQPPLRLRHFLSELFP